MGCRKTKEAPLSEDDARALIDARVREIKDGVVESGDIIRYQSALYYGRFSEAETIAERAGFGKKQRRQLGSETVTLLIDEKRFGHAARVAGKIGLSREELDAILMDEGVREEIGAYFEQRLFPDSVAHRGCDHSSGMETEDPNEDLSEEGEVPPAARKPGLRNEGPSIYG